MVNWSYSSSLITLLSFFPHPFILNFLFFCFALFFLQTWVRSLLVPLIVCRPACHLPRGLHPYFKYNRTSLNSYLFLKSVSSADKEGTCEDIIYNLLVHRWNALKYWKMLTRCQIWTRKDGESFWPFRVTGVWVWRTSVISMMRVAHQIFWWSKKSCQWNENLHLTPRRENSRLWFFSDLPKSPICHTFLLQICSCQGRRSH